MVESVRERINEAGRALNVWAVLNEDVYETQRVGIPEGDRTRLDAVSA
jgi:hypothetical protein